KDFDSRSIIEAAVAGAVFLGLWMLAGHLFVSVVLFLPLTVLFAASYAVVVAALTARAVWDTAHDRLEKAMESQRLLRAAGNVRSFRGRDKGELSGDDGRANAADGEQALRAEAEANAAATFHKLHFALRLEQEVRRCRREGDIVSIALIRVAIPRPTPSEDILEELSLDIARLATDYN